MTEPAPAEAATPAEPITLPGWLLHQAATRPKAVAIRLKELGRWREITWSEYAERVASVGRALLLFEVKPGDRVAILSDNRPEWLITDLAVQGIGAASVGLFVTSTAADVASLIKRVGADVAIAEDEEQFDKLVEVADQIRLRHLLVIDGRGIERLDPPASSYEALEAQGTRAAVELREGADPEIWAKHVGELSGNDVATIAFTPGTTGEPKAVPLTHANLVTAAGASIEALGLSDADEIVSSLSLCEIGERSLTLAQAVRVGATVHFGEGGDALANDLREVQPTVFLGAPYVWSHLEERVDGGLRIAGRIKRGATRFAQRRKRGLGSVLVTRPLRRLIGLGRARVALSTGAPCPADLVAWWHSVGLPLREAYGLTETAGFVTIAGTADQDAPGTCGKAVPGVEVRISGEGGEPGADAREGEVLVRGPSVFGGYLDDEEATRAALDDDGWLHTGDIGVLDNGALSIVGRSKDILITSTGHRVAPRAVEAALEGSQYVQTAVLVGEGRPFVGALFTIDFGTVGDWAAGRGVAFTTYRTLVERPEVRELLRDVVDATNRSLDERDHVKCFALLPQELDVEDEVLTATFKVRRGAVQARYEQLIDDMYAEAAR